MKDNVDDRSNLVHESICRYLLQKNNIPWATKQYNEGTGRPIGEATMRQWLEEASTKEKEFAYWINTFGKSHRIYSYEQSCKFIHSRHPISSLLKQWNTDSATAAIDEDTLKGLLDEAPTNNELFIDWVLEASKDESGIPENIKYKFGRWCSDFLDAHSATLAWCFVVFLFAYRLGISVESDEDHCVYWKDSEYSWRDYDCVQTLSEIYDKQGLVIPKKPIIRWASGDDY